MTLSVYQRTTPKIASIVAISQGAPNRSWMGSSKAAPRSAPGIVPITRAHAMRWSVPVMDRAATEANQALM